MSVEMEAVPAHVPADRVVDFDYLGDPAMATDPRAVYLRLWRGPDVVYTPRNGGHWIATRYADMQEILSKPALFSSVPYLIPKMVSSPEPRPFAEMNPPDHTKYRRLLIPVTSPRAVAAFEANARELMIELIEGVRPQGECDFATDIAQKFPIFIMMRWLNLPVEDRFMLMDLTDKVLGPFPPAIRREARELTEAYVTNIVANRRVNPGDDLISHVVHSEIDGRPVTDREAIAMTSNLIHGGLDTVRSNMGSLALFLARHPDHRRQLVENPSLIPNALEEFFRWHSSSVVARCVIEDTVIGGVEIKKGEQILLALALAGLDERVNDDPLTMDFTRRTPKHLAFGQGAHFCPGMHLAQIELRIFLQEWLARIPDFRLKSGTQPVTVGGIVMGVRGLPLEWDL